MNNYVRKYSVKPLVSVIMTVFNEEKNIERALKSLLEQTYKNIEVIIFDDCSTDNTVGIIEAFFSNNKDLKYVLVKKDKNVGTYYNKNEALDIAKGDFITFIDGDDEYLPKKIENELYTLYTSIDKKLIVVSKFEERKGEETRELDLFSGMMAHRDVFFKICGKFYPTRFGGDWEYKLRLERFYSNIAIFRNKIEYIAYVEEATKSNLTSMYKRDIRHKFFKNIYEEYREKKHYWDNDEFKFI